MSACLRNWYEFDMAFPRKNHPHRDHLRCTRFDISLKHERYRLKILLADPAIQAGLRPLTKAAGSNMANTDTAAGSSWG
jgi:hypothetical protein